MSSCHSVVLAAVMFLIATAAMAAPTPLTATKTWTGSIDNEDLAKEMPDNGVISNAKDFEKLVTAWTFTDEASDVNFDTEIVIVAKTKGSLLRVTALLDEAGDLKPVELASRDFRPGFRYVVISVPKAGIKTVRGKALPQ